MTGSRRSQSQSMLNASPVESFQWPLGLAFLRRYLLDMSVLFEMRSRLAIVQASRVEPCQPSVAAQPPSGRGWIHEIKQDGYRMMIRRDAAATRLHAWGI